MLRFSEKSLTNTKNTRYRFIFESKSGLNKISYRGEIGPISQGTYK